MIDPTYHMTLKILLNCIFDIKNMTLLLTSLQSIAFLCNTRLRVLSFLTLCLPGVNFVIY